MKKEEITEYRSLVNTLVQKDAEYKESIADLVNELNTRRKAYDDSIKDIRDQRDEYAHKLIDEAQVILAKIADIIIDVVGRYHSWSIAEKEFGIVITKDDEYEPGLHSKLKRINKITDECIIFDAEEDFRDGDYASGTISIPIKYFENNVYNLLEDKNYVNEVIAKIKQSERNKDEQAKLAKIAALEAEIARLKG